MMRRIRTVRATSIIEVVMAIVILSVGLPPLLRAFTDSAMQSIDPANATVASFLATERMEQVVARRYRSIVGYSEVTAANFPAETPVSGFGAFNRTVTISEVDSSLNASGTPVGYKKVRVVVSWSSGTKQIAIEHVFAEY